MEEAARRRRSRPLRVCGSSEFYRYNRTVDTPFYKLVARHYGEFKRVYNERYARDFGHFRGVIDRVVAKFLECGDLAKGFGRVRCEGCGHELFVAFSCKQRGFCPSCHQKWTLNFAHCLTQFICEPVAHRQFVFTIPKRFRLYFRYHRRLLGELSRCAWATVKETYAHALGDEYVPGMVSSIQTFGALIHWHPHIHALVTEGGFDPAGRFRPVPAIPNEAVRKIWEHHVFAMLLREKLIDEQVIESMGRWKYSGFSVHKEVYLEANDKEGIEKLAQYIARCSFSQARMRKVTPEGRVLYKSEQAEPQSFPRWRSLPTERSLSRNFEMFEPLDFLAQVTQHVPNRGEHQVRYYGWYSKKARGCRKKDVKQESPAAAGAEKESESKQPKDPKHLKWAALIKKVYEVDPLVCPKCQGQMRVIGFVEQERIIKRILAHVGWSRSPPAGSSCGPGPPDPEVTTEAFHEDLPWG